MSIDAYRSTAQIFHNLCQAGIVGALITLRTFDEEFVGIPIFVWLTILSLFAYITGTFFFNKASKLKRQEEKQRRKL